MMFFSMFSMFLFWWNGFSFMGSWWGFFGYLFKMVFCSSLYVGFFFWVFLIEVYMVGDVGIFVMVVFFSCIFWMMFGVLVLFFEGILDKVFVVCMYFLGMCLMM